MRAAIISVLALWACSPATQTTEQTTTSSTTVAEAPPSTPTTEAGCVFETSRDWTVGADTYQIVASLNGLTCPNAITRLTIKDPSGVSRAEFTYPASSLHMMFAPNDPPERYRENLASWINNVDTGARTTSLPVWPAAAEHPRGFRPDVTRAEYASARTASLPLFCYNNGSEAESCITVQERRVVTLGTKLFERE